MTLSFILTTSPKACLDPWILHRDPIYYLSLRLKEETRISLKFQSKDVKMKIGIWVKQKIYVATNEELGLIRKFITNITQEKKKASAREVKRVACISKIINTTNKIAFTLEVGYFFLT